MKQLQADMLRVLDTAPIDPTTWAGSSVHHLGKLICLHADADPFTLRRAIRKGYPFISKRGAAYKAWQAVVRMALTEATGEAALIRAREQDKNADLFRDNAR